jgi:hypothetical protein
MHARSGTGRVPGTGVACGAVCLIRGANGMHLIGTYLQNLNANGKGGFGPTGRGNFWA